MSAPPRDATLSAMRPRHASVTSTAWMAASSLPVWPRCLVEPVEEPVGHGLCAHGGHEVVGGDLGGRDEDAFFVGERILAAA